jgi:4'-phosphopantetheinyl transferase
MPQRLDWVSPQERVRLDGLRFTKRRTEYLLRRWVGKRTVAARIGLPDDAATLARIEVLNRMTGAPYVVVDGAEAPWEVSLSDRAGCAVAVIGAAVSDVTGALGVDLEVVEPRSDGFLTDFLTAAEQDWVRGRPGGSDPLARDAAANLIWSAKEAALKVLRLGLRADTRSVEVTVESDVRSDGWARFTAARRDGPVLPGWWRRDGVYLVTVATSGDCDPPAMLPGATDIARTSPVHTWLDRPLVEPGE